MAVYKVPQDVEAEDKLIGPFSFRQFIYLIVAALGVFLAWALSRIFIGLVIIPLPVILAMLALALPLRKDQPMETYLIALIKFFFKPRHRMWDPEGAMTLVDITAPKVAEGPQLKDVAGDEAAKRLEYLSQIVDTRGWASRGVSTAGGLDDDFMADASKAEDILDESSSVAQNLDQRITNTDDTRMQSLKEQFQTSMQQPQANAPHAPLQSVFPEPPPTVTPVVPQSISNDQQGPVYNPYPTAMRQKVLHPDGPQPSTLPPQPQAQKGSEEAVSPDIIRLANNNDLSISAIAREAERLKRDDEDEVVISLR